MVGNPKHYKENSFRDLIIIILPEILKEAIKNRNYREILLNPKKYKIDFYVLEDIEEKLGEYIDRETVNYLIKQSKIIKLSRIIDYLGYANYVARSEEYIRPIAAAITINADGIWSIKSRKNILKKEIDETKRIKIFNLIDIQRNLTNKIPYFVGALSIESPKDNLYLNNENQIFNEILSAFLDKKNALKLKVLNIDNKAKTQNSRPNGKSLKELPLKEIKFSELTNISTAERVQFIQLDNYEVFNNEIYVVFVIEELYRFDEKNPHTPVPLTQIKEVKQKNPYYIFGFFDPHSVKSSKKKDNPTDESGAYENKNRQQTEDSENNKITGDYKSLIELLRLFIDKEKDNGYFYSPYIAVILNNAQSLDGSKTIKDFDAEKDEICYFHPKGFKDFYGFGYDDIIDDAIYFLRIQYREDDKKKEQIIYLNEIFEKMD